MVSHLRCLRVLAALVLVAGTVSPLLAQNWRNVDGDVRGQNHSMFRPIDQWPDATSMRTASGFPGRDYWQQRADYRIEAALDTMTHSLRGSERITYHNESPDALDFLWLQLDQNVVSKKHSRSYEIQAALPDSIPPQFRAFVDPEPFDGGYTISRVQLVDANGRLTDADYTIRNTIMRVDLERPLASGESIQFEIDWSYPIPDDGRGAKEKVKDGWLYEMAQWFPRMSVYDDVNGWQTEQFFGQGEFYLNFGNYDVKLTVPWDHIVEATGVLQNPEEVLTKTQRDRLAQAYQSQEPVFILRPEEVMTPESRPRQRGTLTWHFKAENVRDFAWVSSKTYVWDAAGFTYRPGQTPIAIHSLYPRDAMPLWDKVSTRAAIVTLETYGRMSLEYPYPKAANIHGPVFGMEYPMIAFCGARPQPDGTYSDAVERALIAVTIHEVGHNWFPMIVASDERKWTWMDEGLNSFLQHYSEQDYAAKFKNTPIWAQTTDGTFPSRRGPARSVVDYMRDEWQVPIMTESDLIQNNFGPNGYAKPAAGLVMLREQILGPDAFDDAFRTYSEKWAFKHPQPADFFRAIEETAGENLAWFWRGWFYTSYANDQAIAGVSEQPSEKLLGTTENGQHYYRIEVKNDGQLLLPVELEVTFDDGSTERFDLPADVWRENEITFKKGFFSDKKVVRVELDPDEVFADIDREDNLWEAPEVTPPAEGTNDR
jgi:hypothetical protein